MINYKIKYFKYKNKYLNLKGGGNIKLYEMSGKEIEIYKKIYPYMLHEKELTINSFFNDIIKIKYKEQLKNSNISIIKDSKTIYSYYDKSFGELSLGSIFSRDRNDVILYIIVCPFNYNNPLNGQAITYEELTADEKEKIDYTLRLLYLGEAR
jgi:hypothetical protein